MSFGYTKFIFQSLKPPKQEKNRRYKKAIYLVIDEQLHRVVDPLQEHQLIGLPWDWVGEGGPDAPLFGLQP